MTQIQQKIVVPSSVLEKIDAVRGRTLRVRAGTALVAALGVLLAAMALAMLVDWLAILFDSKWRMVLTYSSLGAATLTFCVWLIAAWRQSLQIHHAASDVDQEIPKLEERWSTIAQLSTSPHAGQVHPAMYRKVAQEAASWSPRVDPGQVVSLGPIVRALWCLMAITVVLGLAVLIDTHRTSVLLRRFWAPQSSISATEITVATGNAVVARGEPFEIAAQVKGTPVEQAMLFLESDEGDSKSVTLTPRGDEEEKRLSHRIRSANAGLRFRMRAGDGQTPWYRVEVADRPKIDEIEMTVIPPTYTGQESKQFSKLPRKISTLRGSRLQLAIKPTATVEKVVLQLGGERTETLQVDHQGWYRWVTTLEDSFALSPILTEKHGLSNLRPPTCEFHCREDTPPVVKILKPEDRIAVLPNDTVPIAFSAKDDLGIGSAELLVFNESLAVEGEPLPLATIPIPLDEQQGAKEITGSVNLDLSQFDLANGAQLSFAIRVSEDRSALGNVMAATKTPESQREVKKSTTAQTAKGISTDSTTENPVENATIATKNPDQRAEAVSSATPTPLEKSATPSVRQVSEATPVVDTSQPSGSQNSATEFSPQNSTTDSMPSMQTTDSMPSMQTGYLEVPLAQSTSSNRMQLTVDETATSFDGQRRLELELAIGPYLEEVDVALGKAQQLSRSVLDALEINSAWQARHGRDISKAEAHGANALDTVDKLHNRTRGTLYAFIGLQLVDISQSHIYPARHEFWKAIQTEDENRAEAAHNGWQHTSRARDLLERLTGQFERARRDYALADTVNKIKKMYQIYVENALALMREAGDSSPYSRKMVEFDLDDEYLARLKEVLEMRNAMRAELARLLAEDPRLLRRFLDAQRNRTKVLRYELADLVDQQGAMARKTKAWNVVEEAYRSDLAAIFLQQHVNGIEEIAFSAADLHDRFETWLPLNRDAQDADLQATGELLQQIATATREVSARAGSFAGKKTGFSSSANREAALSGNESPESSGASTTEGTDTIEPIVAKAEQLYEQFNRLEVFLNQLGMRQGQVEIAGFATNRLVETRRLVEKTSAWIRQLQYYHAGEFHRAAEIEQYQLAMATDTLAGKFANLELDLSNTLQISDQTLPEPIAEKARGLLAALDEQVTPNQLAAVYSLRRNQLTHAVSRQEAALEALKLAEREYDEMIRLVIVELDKFPVQDPITSLLDDPTLDELLAQLEQEVPLNELLGIPCRPTNLQIMDDWLRSGAGSGGGGYNASRVLMNKFREQQRKRQRAIEQAYRKALARAMKESEAEGVLVDPSAPARASVDWNRLASQLGDDLQQGRNTAPPERYRRAIEQYFRQISGATDEQPLSE